MSAVGWVVFSILVAVFFIVVLPWLRRKTGGDDKQ
jgi:hypothetical protein